MGASTKISLVTDQSQFTGIGAYARRLLDGLNNHGVGASLVYLGGRRTTNGQFERPIGLKYFKSNVQAPFVLHHNKKVVARARILSGKNIHFTGATYSWKHQDCLAIGTIHDLTFTMPNPFKWERIRTLAVEAMRDYVILDTIRNIKSLERIITISEVSRREIKRLTGRESVVIHHWIDSKRFHNRDKLRSRQVLGLPTGKSIILNVSGQGPNKGRPLLRRLSASLPPDSLLVKIGAPLPEGRVVNVGNVSQEAYPLYFNAADCYIDSSTQEGFGIPLIESLGSSLPVISFLKSISKEILGNAAVYFDKEEGINEVLSIISALNSKGERDDVVSLIEARSKLFQEERCVAEYMKVYRDVFHL